MGLLEGLAPNERIYPCRIRDIIESLDVEDKKIFVDAINNSSLWPAKTLSNAINKRGIKLSDSSITRHRSGDCSC